jgi:hypothetical protein
MDPIIVRRHGGRWAVSEGGETAPDAEYDTRELAEAAARDRAREAGREVRVDESAGDEQLGQVTDPDTPADAGRRRGATDAAEMGREPQAGL